MGKQINNVKLALCAENGKVAKQNMHNVKLKFGWPLKVLILTFCFSVTFSLFSQIISSKVGVILSIIIIFVFLSIGVVFDVLGVAASVCNKQVFRQLDEKGDRAAKIAYKLSSNSEKMSSFCCDIIGDICGVLSGSAGAALAMKINLNLSASGMVILSTIVSAIIASLTVFCKALGKTVAINKSHSIIYKFSKFLTFFLKRRKNEK